MIRKKFRTTTRGSMRKIYKKEKGERHREDNFLTFCNRLHDRKCCLLILSILSL